MMKKTRNTNQRRLVLDAVLRRHDHPSADDIYEDVHNLDPRISRGTVYRNLHILSEMGEIRHLYVLTGADRFDYQTERHYHFMCSSCGKMFNVDLPYLEQLDAAASQKGYHIDGHRMIFEGLCSDCAATGQKAL